VVGSGIPRYIPGNVADRRVAGVGGVPPLPVVVVNKGDEPTKAPARIAASHVVAGPVQPMMTYSALALPGIALWSVTMPPLNLPAAGVLNPTVAMFAQPGFAPKKAAKVG
jgi:hypothetical protein